MNRDGGPPPHADENQPRSAVGPREEPDGDDGIDPEVEVIRAAFADLSLIGRVRWRLASWVLSRAIALHRFLMPPRLLEAVEQHEDMSKGG